MLHRWHGKVKADRERRSRLDQSGRAAATAREATAELAWGEGPGG